MARLQVLLCKLMVRRTHNSRLFGAKLLDLPPPEEETVELHFSRIEMQIYEIVRNRLQQNLQQIAKKGELKQRSTHIWTLILRLRQVRRVLFDFVAGEELTLCQMCGNVLLIQGTIMKVLEHEDFQKLQSLVDHTDADEEDGETILRNLRRALATKTPVQQHGDNVLALDDTIELRPAGETMEDRDDIGGAHGRSYDLKKYIAAATESTEKQNDNWVEMVGEVLPSAKTRAFKTRVKMWFEEEPNEKIIVFTQFLPMARILERVCESEGWGCIKYIGSMSHDARQKAIEEFAADVGKKILIASLACGGQGLNLTMASRVLLMDPW